MDRRFGRDPNGLPGRFNRPWAFGPGGQNWQGGPRGGFPGPGGPGFGRSDLLETMGLKTNENNPNHVDLFRLLEVINKCPNETFPAEIEKILDVDQVLRYLAVSVMLVHLDNYIGMGHNYYFYDDNGRFTILPWDLNMAFGTFRMGSFQQDIADFFIDDKPYLDQYHRYLRELLDGGFAEGVIEPRIDQWIALIRPDSKSSSAGL